MGLLWFAGGNAPTEWLDRAKRRLQEWRRSRPLLGGVLLLVGGGVIGYMPLQFTPALLFIGGTFTILGLLFAVLVTVCGVGALWYPDLSSLFGVAGAAFATLSLFGALGGLLVGTVIGTAGGVLCYAWEPPADSGHDETTLADASAFIWGGTGEFIWGAEATNADGDGGEETDDTEEPTLVADSEGR